MQKEDEAVLRAEIRRLKNEVARLKEANETLEEVLDETLVRVLPAMAETVGEEVI